MDNGITDPNEQQIALNLLKLLSERYNDLPPAILSVFGDDIIRLARRNLIVGTNDVASIFHKVQEDVYNFTVFTKKVSIAVSMILDYGEYDLGNVDNSYFGLAAELMLDEEEMKPMTYTQGTLANFQTLGIDQIGSTYHTNNLFITLLLI